MNSEALGAWVRLWAFGGLEYGFVISAICVWLLWRARGRLREAARAPDWNGLWLAVPVGFATWLSYLLDLRIAQDILFVAAVAALIWAVLGSAVLRITSGPMLIFLLALPIWNVFKPILQAMTVHATAFALQVTGTPVYVDDTYIYTPHGAILVLAQCSGAQYFQAGVTIGALYAYLAFRSLRVRVFSLCAIVAMAVIGNWVRVFVIIHLGALSEWQHFMVGWGIFAALVIAAMLLGPRLQRWDEGLTREVIPVTRRLVLGGGMPRAVIAAVATASLLVSGPIAARRSQAAASGTARRLTPIVARPPWSPLLAPNDLWQPSFIGAEAHAQAIYHRDTGNVWAYWASYPRQGHRSQAVNSTNAPYSAPWEPRGGDAGVHYRRVPTTDGRAVEVIETRLADPRTGAQRLIWHWYCIAGNGAVRPWRAKFLQIGGLLEGRGDATVAVLGTDARDPRAAEALLRSFVLDNFSALDGSACMDRR